MIHEKYIKAQAEQERELEQERRLMNHDKRVYLWLRFRSTFKTTM